MIMDTRLMFATALALNTGAAGTYVMGDVIDLSAQSPTSALTRDIGNGDDIWFFARMITAGTSGGGATLNIQLVSDTASNMTTSPLVLLDSGAIAVATLVAGYTVIFAAVPLMTPRRYLGIKQITGTAAFTGGTFTCGIVNDPSKWLAAGTTTQL